MMASLLSKVQQIRFRKAAQQSSGLTGSETERQESSQINEYEDAELNYNLQSVKFWSIVLSMYLVIFLVALVRHLTMIRYGTNSSTGSKHRCTCYSDDHRPI